MLKGAIRDVCGGIWVTWSEDVSGCVGVEGSDKGCVWGYMGDLE